MILIDLNAIASYVVLNVNTLPLKNLVCFEVLMAVYVKSSKHKF